jgi:hypothetical protein
MVSTVLTDMNPRLEAAAVAVASARESLTAALELRDQLVVAAIDHGMSQRQVAKGAGVAVARICAILADSQHD